MFPGGGYEILAIDLEGTEVCDWLTSKGITDAFLIYQVKITMGEIRGSRRWKNSKFVPSLLERRDDHGAEIELAS